MNSPFGAAPVMREGENVMEQYGYTKEQIASMPKPKFTTDWIEFRLPTDWHKDFFKALDAFLISKGAVQEESGAWTWQGEEI